jgi:hypothetical protein
MQRAAAFVESAGDEVAIARARALIGTQPASVVVELLRDLGSEPSVGRLLRILEILDDLRCTSATPIERACSSPPPPSRATVRGPTGRAPPRTSGSLRPE